MSHIHPNRFLKTVLRLDAATCFLMGVAMTAFSSSLASLFELPGELLMWAGLSLFPFAAMLLLAAGKERVSPALLGAIVVLNLGWAADSFVLGLLGWVQPNTWGSLFLYGQALGTAALAALEIGGWRGSPASRDPQCAGLPQGRGGRSSVAGT